MTWLEGALILLGVGLAIGSVCCLFLDDGFGWALALLCAAVIILLFLFLAIGLRQEHECAKRGGRMVPDGPPTYVMSGKVLVPIQPERCEVP